MTSWMRFLRHYAEMVLAMVAGMFLLAPISSMVYGGDRVDVNLLIMATNMTLGMTLWMLFRRHGWGAIAEMAAAMYLPFLLLLLPFYAGSMDGEMVSHLGHVLMLPAMALVMLRRRSEYSRPHKAHALASDA